MTLPTASELDVWLAGYVAGYVVGSAPTLRLQDDAVSYGLTVLHGTVLRWLRTNNDAATLACHNLPDLERRYSVAKTPEARRDALRALLAARDTVLARAEAYAASQATAEAPLQLGLHPTGVGGEG